MNRTISMLMLVMLLASISSANKVFCQTNPEVALMSDSVSTEFGKAAGTVFGYRAANDSSIDRDVFLRGFDSVVKGDTTTSFITGLQMGLVIMDNIRRVEREGLTFDMATFLREFYQAFSEGATLQEDQVEEIGSGINGLMNRATLVA